MEMSNFVSALPDIIVLLPVLLYVTQLLFYLFFMWFCGSIAIRGYKKHMSFVTGLGARLLAGIVCLVGGMSFSGFIPFFSKGFMHILQIDVLIAGLSVSILLAFALRLITYKEEWRKPNAMMDALKRKVMALEEMLRKGSKSIPEKEARKKAEGGLPGYKADSAKLVGNEWQVDLKLGDKVGKVILDAWNGEIKKKIKKFEVLEFFKDAHKLAGLLMIIAVVGASALFFEGFQDPNDTFTSMFGITMEDIVNMSASLRGNPFISRDIPPGCISPIVLARYQKNFEDIDFVREHLHEDNSTKRIVEENSGKDVRSMLRLDHEGKDLILATTYDMSLCYLTDGKFCACL